MEKQYTALIFEKGKQESALRADYIPSIGNQITYINNDNIEITGIVTKVHITYQKVGKIAGLTEMEIRARITLK